MAHTERERETEEGYLKPETACIKVVLSSSIYWTSTQTALWEGSLYRLGATTKIQDNLD